MNKQHNRVSEATQEERIKAFKKTLEFPLSREEITDTPKTQALVQSWRALDYRRRISDPAEAAEIAKAQGLIAGHRDNLLVLDWLMVNDRCVCEENVFCDYCYNRDTWIDDMAAAEESKQDAEIYF